MHLDLSCCSWFLFIRNDSFAEYKNSVNQDRFLIMAVEAETRESSNFASLWKNADEGSKVEHKLRCRFAGSTENNSALQSAPDVDVKLLNTFCYPTGLFKHCQQLFSSPIKLLILK